MKSRLILALAAVLAIAVGIAPSAFRGQRATAAVSSITLPGLNRIQQRILSGVRLVRGQHRSSRALSLGNGPRGCQDGWHGGQPVPV
jgi:hypothetical protein